MDEITEALEELRRRNLLGYSEKQGYKIQSTAGEEWERERREFGVSRETISTMVQEALKLLIAAPERPKLEGRPFPWAAVFSDVRHFQDQTLVDPREDAAVRVDFRFLSSDERLDSTWVKRSDELALRNRLVWVCGDIDQLDEKVRDLARAREMLKKYKPRQDKLNPARKLLLQQEVNRAEDLEKEVSEAVANAWMSGRMYFRAHSTRALEHGAAFSPALKAAATRILPDLFPHFDATAVEPSELMQLLEPELSGPSPKFLSEALGILELDAGRYEPACSGVIPRRVQEYIESQDGLSGGSLLSHFGGPPFGYTDNVVKACVAGLLRAGRLRVTPEGGNFKLGRKSAGSSNNICRCIWIGRITPSPTLWRSIFPHKLSVCGKCLHDWGICPITDKHPRN